ncbi:hypothetical protein PRZ48_000670 [Zasmidium cellare]|uniref:Uncharacterized protein n=1 Tax=Zasmidium cellare TaxID=395010 RepID=A0ABR0EZ49_ZASCE|nr:hypothetical protein PRZ48_000670 [Zasmidium cellare]
MSDLQGDMLAVRCSDLLRSLLAIEKDAASQFSLAMSNDEAGQSRGHPAALIVRVPYLGSIQISRTGVTAVPATSVDQDQITAEEGVTIGGIGSMSVQESPAMDADETANNALHQATSMPVGTDPTRNRQAEHNAPLATADAHVTTNPMFPDAAASFDDWVFQGVDTAFMETLLSGSGIPFSAEDDLGDESWDISTLP